MIFITMKAERPDPTPLTVRIVPGREDVSSWLLTTVTSLEDASNLDYDTSPAQ